MKYFVSTACIFLLFLFVNHVLGEDTESEEYEETAITFKPTFLSIPTTTYLHENESLTLNCSVDKLGGLVLIWKLGPTMLTIDKRNFDSGVSLIVNSPNSYSLVIKNVTKKYEGIYECLISYKELEAQAHNVQILRPPSIKKVPEDGQVSEVEGKSAIMVCNVTGNPMPNVTWSKDGKEITEGISGAHGQKLTLESISMDDEGDYKCVASNKMMEDATDSFKLSIEFAPKVEVENTWVHSGEGVSTEITCTVHASKPLKRIAWIRKSGNEQKDAKMFTDPKGTTHTLKLDIRKMTKDDFGDYTCYAENNLGHDSKKTRISGLPEKVQIKSEEKGTELNTYMLKWNVKSYSQIFQYSLKYRESKVTSHFDAINIPPTSSSSAVLHSQTHEMTGLKNDTKYDVVVLARNVFGWSEPSDIFTFTTISDKVEPPQISNEIQDDIKQSEITNEIQVEAKSSTSNSGNKLRQDTFTAALFLMISTWSIFRLY